MKAITLTQPWATLMAAGEKRIETRSWSPYMTLNAGQLVAIHAGKGLADMSPGEFDRLCCREPYKAALMRASRSGRITTREPGKLTCTDLPRGAIVAVATFYAAYRTDIPAAQAAVEQSIATGALHEREFGNFRPGRYAWIFTTIRPLLHPIKARGRQGLWDWEPPLNLDELLAPVGQSGSTMSMMSMMSMMTARDVAKWLVRPYVRRGDSLEPLRHGGMGAGCDWGNVRIHLDHIFVTRIGPFRGGWDVNERFRLADIYHELERELRGRPQQTSLWSEAAAAVEAEVSG